MVPRQVFSQGGILMKKIVVRLAIMASGLVALLLAGGAARWS